MAFSAVVSRDFEYKLGGELLTSTPILKSDGIVSREGYKNEIEVWEYIFTSELANGEIATWHVLIRAGLDYPFDISFRRAELKGMVEIIAEAEFEVKYS